MTAVSIAAQQHPLNGLHVLGAEMSSYEVPQNVVVIGGGIVGSSIAWHLLTSNLDASAETHRISYNAWTGDGDQEVHKSSLFTSRHFVGWTNTAYQHAGKIYSVATFSSNAILTSNSRIESSIQCARTPIHVF